MLRWYRDQDDQEPLVKKRKMIDLTVGATEPAKEWTLTCLSKHTLTIILLMTPVKYTSAIKCTSKEYLALVDSIENNNYWRMKVGYTEKINIRFQCNRWKEIYEIMYSSSTEQTVDKDVQSVREYIIAYRMPADKIEEHFRLAIINQHHARVYIILCVRIMKNVLFKYTLMAISMSTPVIVSTMLRYSRHAGVSHGTLAILAAALDRADIPILEVVTAFYKDVLFGPDGKWNSEWSGVLLRHAIKLPNASVLKYLLSGVGSVSEDTIRSCLATVCRLGDKELVGAVMEMGKGTKVPASTALIECASNGKDELVSLIMSNPYVDVSDDRNALLVFACSTGRSVLAFAVINHKSFNRLVPGNKHITLAIDNKHIALAMSVIRHHKTDLKAHGHAVVKHCLDMSMFTLARAILVDTRYS